MWTRARAAFDFVGTTSEMQVALARLSVLTGMEATLTVGVDLQHLPRGMTLRVLEVGCNQKSKMQRSHIGAHRFSELVRKIALRLTSHTVTAFDDSPFLRTTSVAGHPCQLCKVWGALTIHVNSAKSGAQAIHVNSAKSGAHSPTSKGKARLDPAALSAEDLMRVSATQRGDWAMYRDCPFGVS
jgi:hypothetical protein